MRFHALWWWIDRWRKSTAYTDMTLAEQGAYRNLLDEATLRGGALPLDDRVLAKACGDAKGWNRVRAKVMARFELREGAWHNATLDEVLAKSVEISERRSEAGVAGAEKRWQRHRKQDGKAIANGIATTSQTPSQTDGIPSPISHLPSEERTPPSGGETRARVTSGLSRGLLKPNGNVAFEGPRVHVPWKQHFKYVRLRNNPNAEAELQTFYQHVSEAWTAGVHAEDSPGADMLAFWDARYNEEWPPTVPASHSKLPKWMQK